MRNQLLQNLSNFRLATIILLLVGMIQVSDLTAQCSNRALACNNLVRIPLDENCQAVITIDMILEDRYGSLADYELQIFDPSGNRINTNILTEDYDCEPLEVRVICKASGNYCWGYVIIEDKVKPSLTISPLDTAVYCTEYDFNLTANSLATTVLFSDQGSCEKPDSLGITEITIDNYDNCGDTLATILRYWKVVDKSKYLNDSTVIQHIHILRPTFDMFEYPRDTTIDCREADDLSVVRLGRPELRSCHDYFDTLFTQVEFEGICGAARKISRRWKIIDRCRNIDTTVYQAIEVIDTSSPVIDWSSFTLPSSHISTNKVNCTADALSIPNPIITDCSLIHHSQVRAYYQLVDDAGQPYGVEYEGVVNEDDIFDVYDLPIGQNFYITFEVTDSCGYRSKSSNGPFKVQDDSEPNAVCEQSTIVVINNSGITELFAESVDDYSEDNCGIVKKEIRRINNVCAGRNSDFIYGESVFFCCEDVSRNPVKVRLRVYDAQNNFSECTIDVIVQDKRVPTISCVQRDTFNCDFPIDNLRNTLLQSPPTVNWPCSPGTLDVELTNQNLSACNIGTVTAVWTAIDGNGQSNSCTEIIRINNKTDVTLIAPLTTIDVTNCSTGITPDDLPGSKPLVLGADCENIAITYEDLPFDLADDETACRKLRRKWTVLDWCKFSDGGREAATIAVYDQIIKITDNQAPLFTTVFADLEITDADKDCIERFNYTAQATDSCTPDDELMYTYTITQNGQSIATGTSSTISANLSVGVYLITFTVTDQCENSDQASLNLEVKTNKEPSPVLIGVRSVDLTANGSVTILASDFNIKSTNGCTSSEDGLRFAFSENVNDNTRTLNCGQLSNGVSATVEMPVYVIDAIGQYSFATVTIIINDPQDVCPDTNQSSTAVVRGLVTDENDKAVAQIGVSATNLLTNETYQVSSDIEGNYAITGLQKNDDYELSASLDGYDMAGVTTLDIVLIQRHILGLSPLNSPYKVIAADVNRSGNLSAADLSELRKFILGIKDEMTSSWVFISKDHEFEDTNYPWSYPSQVELLQLNDDLTQIDFVAIKVGDVNDNAVSVMNEELASTRSRIPLEYQSEQSEDLTTTYTLTPRYNDGIMGLQLALDIGNQTELIDVLMNGISVDPAHYHEHAGVLSMSITDMPMDASIPIFEIIVRSDDSYSGSKELQLSPHLSAEIYSTDLEVLTLTLERVSDLPTSDGVVLLQNIPNPFFYGTTVEFLLSAQSDVQFDVIDLSGRSIYHERGEYAKGIHQIQLTTDQLGGQGIYYYTITTNTESITKRMVVLR